MTRIDYLLIRRLSARIGLVIAIFIGLFVLATSLDPKLIKTLNEEGGPIRVILGLGSAATRIVLGSLPVPVVIGTIIAALDLQVTREMTVIKSTGLSIWRVLRAPLILAALGGVLVSALIEPLVVNYVKTLPLPNAPAGSGGVLWIEQDGADGPYILTATRALEKGTKLEEVTIFLTSAPGRDRIEAATATLVAGAWELEGAARYLPNAPAQPLPGFRIATETSAGDMRVRFTVPATSISSRPGARFRPESPILGPAPLSSPA